MVLTGDAESTEHTGEAGLGDGAEHGGILAPEQFHELGSRKQLGGPRITVGPTVELAEEPFQSVGHVVGLVHELHLSLFLLSEEEALTVFYLVEQLGIELVVVDAVDADDAIGLQNQKAT